MSVANAKILQNANEETLAEYANNKSSRLNVLTTLNAGKGAELLAAYLGDRSRKNQQALAIHYSLCAEIVARRFFQSLNTEARRLLELNDLEQIAQCGLFTLLERFDPSRGVPLSAFLLNSIPMRVIDELRSLGAVSRSVHQDKPLPKTVPLHVQADEEESVPVNQIASSEMDPAKRMENRQFRRAALRSLPQRCRLYVAHRYFRGKTMLDAAGRAGISRQGARAMEREAVPLLLAFIDRRPSAPRPPQTPKAFRQETAVQPLRKAA